MTKKFGPLIREVRIQKGIGQRSLASKIGVSASYLNDIEKEKRTAPKLNIIKKISSILSIDNKRLNDLAGYSKKSLAPDINDFIVKNPKINSTSVLIPLLYSLRLELVLLTFWSPTSFSKLLILSSNLLISSLSFSRNY